jgi:hypothetical protein
MEVDTIHQTTQEDPQSQTQTQPQTQSQQSQGATDQRNAHSWGLLVPCARGIKREHLLKSTPEVTIGRNASNHVSLSWSGLSNILPSFFSFLVLISIQQAMFMRLYPGMVKRVENL